MMNVIDIRKSVTKNELNEIYNKKHIIEKMVNDAFLLTEKSSNQEIKMIYHTAAYLLKLLKKTDNG